MQRFKMEIQFSNIFGEEENDSSHKQVDRGTLRYLYFSV